MPSGGQKLVYIMDDMPILSRMYCEFLTRHGYETEVSINADVAFERLHNGKRTPDLLILDVNVPGSMNGIELCKKLRQTPRYERVPIVILTANPAAENDAWAAGCDAFFTKPCRLDALVEAIGGMTRLA